MDFVRTKPDGPKFSYSYSPAIQSAKPTVSAVGQLWNYVSGYQLSAPVVLKGKASKISDLPKLLGLEQSSPSQATTKKAYWQRVEACPAVEVLLSGEYEAVINSSKSDAWGISTQLKSDYTRQQFIFQSADGAVHKIRPTHNTDFQQEIVLRFHDICGHRSYEVLQIACQTGIVAAYSLAHAHFTCDAVGFHASEAHSELQVSVIGENGECELTLTKAFYINDLETLIPVADLKITAVYSTWDTLCLARAEYIGRKL